MSRKDYRRKWWQIWLPICEHYWRPACIRRKPAKLCDYCEVVHILTEEEFYAQFGWSFKARMEGW